MRTAKQRRDYKVGMPRAPLQLKHTRNCKVLPDRETLLDALPDGGVVAEVGVACGDFSAQILARVRPDVLHLIDAWSVERYACGRDKVEARFEAQIKAGTVRLHQGPSSEMLAAMDDDVLDWVYIDTFHSYEVTIEELRISRRKVRKGGRIAGHDFCIGNVKTPLPYGVIEACSVFCHDHDWEYEYLTLESDGYFSYCLREMTGS